jgi:hypothetical protein
MALCDQLETAIEAQQHANSRLRDALIAQVLVDSPEPQSVEAGVQLHKRGISELPDPQNT